ncbi:MAG: ferritin-like domain-containing protein [Desulfovibrionales bacterium]
MTNHAQDMLCDALEMAESRADFYTKAVNACEAGPGKEVFERLYEDEKAQIQRIKEIHENIVSGKAWADACSLPEEESVGGAAMFRSIVDKYGKDHACTTEIGAIGTGLELQKASVDFFEEWLKKAQDPTEKKFVERMVQEERGHFMLLSDLQYFYEDPQGWSLKEDDQILDGA